MNSLKKLNILNINIIIIKTEGTSNIEMNPHYADMLRSLKLSTPQQMPIFQQQMPNMVKDQLKSLFQQISELQKQIKTYQSQLNSLQSQQVINLPQTQSKKDRYNFLRSKLSILLDQYYRIKRFLLIYHNTRLNKIQQQFWLFSGNLRSQTKNNLSEIQKQYFNDYKLIVTQYMQQVELQLNVDIDPPIDSCVQVRFLKDCGEILSDQGEPIVLVKNTVLYIKKRLIQKFIKQGSAQIITSNFS